MKINEAIGDEFWNEEHEDEFRRDAYYAKHPYEDKNDPEETNLEDCQNEAYDVAKDIQNRMIKENQDFLDQNGLEIVDTDIEWDFKEYSIPREFNLIFYVRSSDENADDDVQDIECTLELGGEFIGRDWNKYYPATNWEPAEGGYFDYVEYKESPYDFEQVNRDFVLQINEKIGSEYADDLEPIEEGLVSDKYEEIAKKLFSFYRDYDPYGYDDAFGGLTGVNENDAINDTITSLVYDPQNTLDELEEIKKDLEISLEDGENDADRNYLRTVNDLIDTINALPNLNEAMFGPYKYRYEVHYVGDKDYLLGGSRDIDRAIDIACNQLENIASNPWEDANKKRNLINSLYILDSETNEKVDSDDLRMYKKQALDTLKESLGEAWDDYDEDEDKYTLVGVDGNAYAVMGYTANALRREGLRDLVKKMYEEATSSDYDHLLVVCLRYIDMANAAARGEDLDESVDKNPVKWEIIRKHKVQKPIDAFDFVDYISDEEILETTEPMTRREAEKYAKKKYGSAKSKSGSGIHKVFVESEMNESAETTKLYKAISDTADAIDDLTSFDVESAKKNLDSADDKISDVKDNLEEDPEEGWH